MFADLLMTILGTMLKNEGLQDQLAEPAADTLADLLPDATEDSIAQMLRKIADRLEAANP